MLPMTKNVSSFSSLMSASEMEQGPHGNESSFSLYKRIYSVKRRKDSGNILQKRLALPPSADIFYNGLSPLFEVVELCSSTMRLNLYLRSTNDIVSAGVPGYILHAVMREDQMSDVGAVVSSIMYTFYLSETSVDDQVCVVPVINMMRKDLNVRMELKWLLDSCQIDQTSLIFLDEIDLSYYDLFGCLKVISLDGNSASDDNNILSMKQDSSFCTLVAEKFAQASPNILRGRCFSRFLLAGILLDTENLTSPTCTTVDKYMATLLISGAGRFGCTGFFQLLRIKKYDVSSLKIVDILLKDFKKWPRGKQDSRAKLSHIGMCSIGVSITQLCAQQKTSIQDIKHFQQSEKLRLLMVVSGYYDTQGDFKRQVLVSTESMKLLKIMLNYLNSCSSQLPLKVLHQTGLRTWMRVFEIDKMTSEKTIQVVLEDFGRNLKHQSCLLTLAGYLFWKRPKQQKHYARAA